MSMTGPALASAIKSAITALDPASRSFDAVWNTVAQAIIDYIHTNAVVSGAVTVTSVSGVTAGAAASGPGTGTMSAGTIA
jgi:hypothetical protein